MNLDKKTRTFTPIETDSKTMSTRKYTKPLFFSYSCSGEQKMRKKEDSKLLGKFPSKVI